MSSRARHESVTPRADVCSQDVPADKDIDPNPKNLPGFNARKDEDIEEYRAEHGIQKLPLFLVGQLEPCLSRFRSLPDELE